MIRLKGSYLVGASHYSHCSFRGLDVYFCLSLQLLAVKLPHLKILDFFFFLFFSPPFIVSDYFFTIII